MESNKVSFMEGFLGLWPTRLRRYNWIEKFSVQTSLGAGLDFGIQPRYEALSDLQVEIGIKWSDKHWVNKAVFWQRLKVDPGKIK